MGTPPAETYADRATSFVDLTAGMVNLWDIDDPLINGEVYLTGVGGEVLRRFVPATQRPQTIKQLQRLFRPGRFNLLRLVRPELATRLHQELTDDLTTAWGLVEPLDLLHAHYCRYRLRFSRLGPRQELVGDLRLQPLYTLPALRSAMAMPAQARHDEALVKRMMELSVPELVNQPFAGPAWGNASAGPPSTPETGSPRPKAKSLMATTGRRLQSDRAELFHAVVADAGNPAWENLNRKAMSAALDNYSSLGNRERRELYGAATQALWLRDSRTPDPVS